MVMQLFDSGLCCLLLLGMMEKMYIRLALRGGFCYVVFCDP